jgi:hypothetical protein
MSAMEREGAETLISAFMGSANFDEYLALM